MALVETLRGTANTWECDENGHLNVQHYWAKFADARAHFALISGWSGGTPLAGHVRYHAEVLPAGGLVVRSGLVSDGLLAGALYHEMRDAETDELIATALHHHAESASLAGPGAIRAPPVAPTRSFPAGPEAIPETDASLVARGLSVTNRSRLTATDIEPDGLLCDRAIVARFSDAAPHAWALVGLTSERMRAAGWGRVSVEMKITRGQARPSAGAAVHLRTGVTALARSTFCLRHHVIDSASGDVIAVGDLAMLILDLAARRAVPVPPEVAEAASRLIEPGSAAV